MPKKKTRLKSGAAFVWFFATDIITPDGFIDPATNVLAPPQVDATVNNGNNPETVDNTTINDPVITGEGVSGGKRLVTEIRPEQQLNEASLSLERDNFEINTQISSRPTEYTKTGVDGTLELSIADITLRNIALAFGYEDEIKSQDIGGASLTEAQRLHLIDNAGAFLKKFALILIPAPPQWTANEDDKIEWRNSWVYIPQASVVDANPTLTFGINQQQEIQVTVRSTPDFRKNSDRPYTSENRDRVILGYPNI